MTDQSEAALNYSSAFDESLAANLVEAAADFTRALAAARDAGLTANCEVLPGGVSVVSVRRSISLWPRTGVRSDDR